MVEKGMDQATPLECREKDEAVSPIGDFIAQVGSTLAAIFVFLGFYTNQATGEVIKGYETAYGIIILIAAVLTFGFATTVLWFKFEKRDFWLKRSPGWAYGAAAFVVIVVSVLALAFPSDGYDIIWGPLVLELFIGLTLALAGMFKF